MTIYNITQIYENNKLKYIVSPYSLKGVVINHFRYYGGLKSLIMFLKDCRITEKSAEICANKKNRKI